MIYRKIMSQQFHLLSILCARRVCVCGRVWNFLFEDERERKKKVKKRNLHNYERNSFLSLGLASWLLSMLMICNKDDVA